MSHSLVNENKRYIRFSKWAAHPSWLGWSDHSLFPYGEEVPSFFYIRKFNVFGDFFQEQKLLNWIEKNHYDNVTANCTTEDISVNKYCLRAILSEYTKDNHLIVVAVNRPYLLAAANLGCSFKSIGKQNILFWSLDLSIHQALLSVGRLSIFLPGFPNVNDNFNPGDKSYQSFLKYKTVLIRYIIEAGFDITIMDSDSIILSDFFGSFPKDIDVFFSATQKVEKDQLEISSSFIHLRYNNRTLDLVKKLENAVTFYPSQRLEWIMAGLIQNSKIERPIGYQLVYPDFGHALHFSNISSDPENLTVKILDPKEYIDWKSTLFTQQESKLEKVNLIHYGNSDHIKSILKSSGLWFVSDSGRCYIRTAN